VAIDEMVGVAGLAFQAVDLATKAIMEAIDGADAGSHRARMQRLTEIVVADQDDLDFLWDIRQRDFYGDPSPGRALDLPAGEQVRQALTLARSIVERIDRALHDAT